MNLSTKLKAALTPKEKHFTESDKKYFADIRWKNAKRLANELKFSECEKLVANIDRDHGKYH